MSLNVRKKFNEAEFFFERIQNTFEKVDPSCDYFVSAFLSAARSITFIIQKENKEWWDQNYPPTSLPLSFAVFNSLRVMSVHQTPVNVSHKIDLEFQEGGLVLGPGTNTEIPINLWGKSKQVIKNAGEEIIGTQKRTLAITAYDESKKSEIKFDNFIDEAATYLAELRKIVNSYPSS
jgi:hypothetical protein